MTTQYPIIAYNLCIKAARHKAKIFLVISSFLLLGFLGCSAAKQEGGQVSFPKVMKKNPAPSVTRTPVQKQRKQTVQNVKPSVSTITRQNKKDGSMTEAMALLHFQAIFRDPHEATTSFSSLLPLLLSLQEAETDATQAQIESEDIPPPIPVAQPVRDCRSCCMETCTAGAFCHGFEPCCQLFCEHFQCGDGPVPGPVGEQFRHC